MAANGITLHCTLCVDLVVYPQTIVVPVAARAPHALRLLLQRAAVGGLLGLGRCSVLKT